MITFKELKLNNDLTYLLRTDENGTIVTIPPDPENTDYQAYLAWLEEGNEPLPADAPAET